MQEINRGLAIVELLTLNSLDELPLVLFSAMQDGVIVTDKKSVIIDCNPAFHLGLGYEKNELIGRSVASLDTPEFAPRLAERVKEIEQKGVVTLETAHCRKDGSVMPVEITAHLCMIKGEKAFFGIVRDISERKLAEHELLRRQEQLSQAEALAHIGNWELDLVQNRLDWSDEIFRIFEIDQSRLEPSYEGFLNAIHPDDRELVDVTYHRSIESGDPYEITHRLLMQDGRIKWVIEKGQTFYERGKAIRSIGTVQDITKRKQAEDALRNSEAHVRSLIETLPDLVWLKDPEGVYISCNHRFESFFGAKEAEIVGKTDYDFVSKELADFFRENDRCAIEAGGPSVNEETITFAEDGHSEMLEVIKTPMYDPEGDIVGVLGIARNITERKKLEDKLKEGFEVYQAAINTTTLGFWTIDGKGCLRDVNESYARMSGYSRDELLGMSIPDLEYHQSPEEIKANIEKIMQTGYARFRTEHRRKDGSVLPVEVVTTFSPIQNGRFFAFIEDISERVEQEQRLELASRVFHTMNQAVVVTDASNKIISINPMVTEITGYTLDEIRGKDPNIFASGRHDQEFYADMWTALNSTGRWEGEIWDRRKDGAVYPKWLTINCIRDQHGNAIQYVSVFSDITERKKTEELIWKQANYDALTGLANRLMFNNRLQQELANRKRRGERLAVIYLDLDGFKDVNDTLGHAAGDELLVEVSGRLGKLVRKTDTVSRLGGDEFTLLITDFQQSELIGSLAEQVLNEIQKPVNIQGSHIRISASVGIALYPEDGQSLDELTKHADVAMYQAKAAGKNNFKFFQHDMNARAVKRMALIHDLHNAVENQAFQLYYQPKIRLADSRTVGMEALIRWTRDDGQMVPPDSFIPCAEETGLIIPVGRWVLTEACRHTREWNSRYNAGLKIAVNLSARQFRSKGIVDEVMHALQAHDLEPSLLELEITESILMEDVEEAIQLMRQLRDAGISIAIDDFGTGYSSLSYLKRFPINTLKIDRSFIHELTEDSQDAAIVRSTINMAKSLGLEVVAEGVENEEQFNFLQEHECHSCQGYHFGKPMSADKFAAFLESPQGRLSRDD